MPLIIREPLDLARFVHVHHDGVRKGQQLGSWFSEALHHVTGSPDASDQKAMVDQFRTQVTDSVVGTLAPLATQSGSSVVPGAPSSLDSFLSANRGLLMAGGAGLLLLVLLKPKKSASNSGLVYMPMPISSPAPAPAKGK